MSDQFHHTDVEGSTLDVFHASEYTRIAVNGDFAYLPPREAGGLVMFLVSGNAYLDAGQRAELAQLLHEKE